jgi:hypothetical protein
MTSRRSFLAAAAGASTGGSLLAGRLGLPAFRHFSISNRHLVELHFLDRTDPTRVFGTPDLLVAGAPAEDPRDRRGRDPVTFPQ